MIVLLYIWLMTSAMLLKRSVRYITFSTSAMQSLSMPTGLEGRSASGCLPKIMAHAFLLRSGALDGMWVPLGQFFHLGDEIDDAKWFGNNVVLKSVSDAARHWTYM